jgi:hypothetical protein
VSPRLHKAATTLAAMRDSAVMTAKKNKIEIQHNRQINNNKIDKNE